MDYDSDIYITSSNLKLLSGELSTHLTCRYYEVDFVCRKHKETIYVQVNYLLESEKKTIEREFRPFSKIKDHYPKYIITMDQFDRS